MGVYLHGVTTVFRLEWLLFRRRRRLWGMGILLALLGINVGTAVHSLPLDAWGSLTNTSFAVSLLLAVLAGDGLARDRHTLLEGVLLSTPLPSGAYVWGAYLADLAGLLLLSCIYPLLAMLADRGDVAHHPPLGPLPYLAGWAWLIALPVAFGSALALAGMTALDGRRVLAAAIILLVWVLPGLAPGRLELLDVPTVQLATRHQLMRLDSRGLGLSPGARAPSPQQLAQAVARRLPPPFPTVFYANRVLLLAMSATLVGATAWTTARRRCTLA